MEQELLTLPEHLRSPPIFSGVRVTRSLVFDQMFCRSLFVLLYFCTFSFGHCIVRSSSIYGFRLPLCYHQTLLERKQKTQWQKEEEQTTQWQKEEEQKTQWPKEEEQTTQWPKEKIQKNKQ